MEQKEINNITKKETSIAWGVASLVTGVLSLIIFIMPYFGLPLAIFSIVANEKQKKIKPLGLGLAGMICGILGIILNIITGLFFLLTLMVMGSI